MSHIAPKSQLYAVFAALMVLTVITVAVSRVDLGAFNLPVALAVAVTKAALIAKTKDEVARDIIDLTLGCKTEQ